MAIMEMLPKQTNGYPTLGLNSIDLSLEKKVFISSLYKYNL